MTSKSSRLYTIIAIGVFAVLSVAVVLTAITVTRSNLTTRSSDVEDDKKCTPVTTETLKEALGANGKDKLCDNRKDLLVVKYQGKEHKCGQTSTIQETDKAPSVKLANADKGARYTLVMLDPDAPSHSLEALKFWLHWAQTEISGKALKNGTMDGESLMKYAGPTPPKGTGVHRYIIVLFESTKQGKANLGRAGGRSQLLLADFVKNNGLCRINCLFQFTVTAEK